MFIDLSREIDLFVRCSFTAPVNLHIRRAVSLIFTDLIGSTAPYTSGIRHKIERKWLCDTKTIDRQAFLKTAFY
jgi:hypothetical protein